MVMTANRRSASGTGPNIVVRFGADRARPGAATPSGFDAPSSNSLVAVSPFLPTLNHADVTASLLPIVPPGGTSSVPANGPGAIENSAAPPNVFAPAL